MKDRIPLYPGRVKLVPVDGEENTYDLVRADQPTQAGTPLNKSSLLKDTTSVLYGLDENALPDDVLAMLPESLKVASAEVKTAEFSRNWKSVTISDYSTNTSYYSGASIGNTMLLAFSYNEYLYIERSDDGKTWVRSNYSYTGGSTGTLVSNGEYAVYVDASHGVSIYTTDGLTWHDGSISGDSSSGNTRVAYGNGVFVAASQSVKFSSDNGKTWNSVSKSVSGYNGLLIFYKGKFYLSRRYTDSGNVPIYTSDDGNNWTKISTIKAGNAYTNEPSNFFGFNDILTIVIPSDQGRSVYQSTDYGVTWKLVSSSSMSDGDLTVKFAYATVCGNKIISLSGNIGVYESYDAKTWVKVESDFLEKGGTIVDQYGCIQYYEPHNYLLSCYKTPLSTQDIFETKLSLVTPKGTVKTDEVNEALGSVKIETGTYTGTGTSGENSPNTLTFSFVPVVVIFTEKGNPTYGLTINANYWSNVSSILWSSEVNYINKMGQYSSSYIKFSQNGNTLQWYGGDAKAQMNYSGTTYSYIAIG
mgnify:CR=1 FL=1